jgi:hypothetical protein
VDLPGSTITSIVIVLASNYSLLYTLIWEAPALHVVIETRKIKKVPTEPEFTTSGSVAQALVAVWYGSATSAIGCLVALRPLTTCGVGVQPPIEFQQRELRE